MTVRFGIVCLCLLIGGIASGEISDSGNDPQSTTAPLSTQQPAPTPTMQPTLTPTLTCPVAPSLPQSVVDTIASTPCGDGYIGQKTFMCKLVDSEPQWVLTKSECNPIKPSTGTVTVSVTIEISGVTITEGSNIIDTLRRIFSILLKVPYQSILIYNAKESSRRLEDTLFLEVRVSIDTSDQKKVEAISSLSSAIVLEEAKKADPVVFPPKASITFAQPPKIVDASGNCGDGFISLFFSKEIDGTSCQVRVSDYSMKTDGLVLIDKLTSRAGYCVNSGYYYLGCDGPTMVTMKFLDTNDEIMMDMTTAPYWKVLRLEQMGKNWNVVPGSHLNPDFDKNTPLTGQPAYPVDPVDADADFTCDEKGYEAYLSKWGSRKSVLSDENSKEFQTRLKNFIESCESIHDWNKMGKYRMEFSFYADWNPEEFEELFTSKQRYSGIKTPVPSVIPVYNNTNYRYLMPSMDPCDLNAELRETITRPQNCSVSWAFAITNSIEYAIKKMYFEEYDQIVEVSLSAQELIDCVGKEHGVVGKVCDGMPLIWGFEYIYENGIAFSEDYPHTNVEGECKKIDEKKKYHIAGYEKPSAFNKLGLFDLMMKGPVAVTLGLDPAFFQYYRNDRTKGPYFNTAFWRPSVFGVVVEYSQYAVEGQPGLLKNPYFAVETRLRACDSFVFRLPILETTENANSGGIAAFAIRPLITELLPTPEPFTISPTSVVEESSSE